MGIEIEEELYDLRARVRIAESRALRQKGALDLAVAQRDGERRKAHTEKLKGIAIAAINAKRVAPSTLTHFTTRFGADNSDAIMGFTSNDVVEWLRVSGRPDKTQQPVTFSSSRPEADETGAVDEPATFAFSRLLDTIAAEEGVTRAQRQDANIELRIMRLAQQRDPELYRRHAAGDWD